MIKLGKMIGEHSFGDNNLMKLQKLQQNVERTDAFLIGHIKLQSYFSHEYPFRLQKQLISLKKIIFSSSNNKDHFWCVVQRLA